MPRPKAQVTEFFAEIQAFLDEHRGDTFTLATRGRDGDVESVRYTFNANGKPDLSYWPPRAMHPRIVEEASLPALKGRFPRAAGALSSLKAKGAIFQTREDASGVTGIAISLPNRAGKIRALPGMRLSSVYPYADRTMFNFDDE